MGKSDLHSVWRGWRPVRAADPCAENCGRRHPREKGVRSLFVYMGEVMYDVEAEVSMVASSRRGEGGVEMLPLTDNVERYGRMFSRWVGKRVGEVRERLVRDVVGDVCHVAPRGGGDNLVPSEEWELRLSMPDWWDEAAWEPLLSAVHDYIVNGVLEDYFKLVLTGGDALTRDVSESRLAAWGRIRSAACRQVAGTVRRYINPMGF